MAVAAVLTHRNRAEIITQALRESLEEIDDDETVTEGIVERYLDGEISVEVLTGFVGPQITMSVRTPKTVLDRDDELAEEPADL